MQIAMQTESRYVARTPRSDGTVDYDDEEHAVWAELYRRQTAAISGRACAEFLAGLEQLRLPADRLPQLPEVSRRLHAATGWTVAPVPALIPVAEFFALLAARRFPAATFIRRREQLGYLEEPDIFHEIFGHVPLLTHRAFASFTECFGRLGLAAPEADRRYLERLYWFTVEFGLVMDGGAGVSRKRSGRAGYGAETVGNTGLRIYGGGILSSIGETTWSLDPGPQRRRFDLIEVLRTPYRIDIMQPLYYVLASLDELLALTRVDLRAAIAEARRLGELPAQFPPRPATVVCAARGAS